MICLLQITIKIFTYALPTPSLPIQTPVLYCFSQMLGANIITTRKVSNGSGNLQDTVIRPGAEIEAVHGGFEQVGAYGAYLAYLLQQLAAHLRVAVNARVIGIAGGLYFPRLYHPFPYYAAGL